MNANRKRLNYAVIKSITITAPTAPERGNLLWLHDWPYRIHKVTELAPGLYRVTLSH